MKNLSKCLFTILAIIACISCKSKTGEDIITQYILDSVFTDKREIYDIQILSLDSCYSKPSDEAAYQKVYKDLFDRKMQTESEIMSYNESVCVLGGDGLSSIKGLVDFYVGCIRDDVKQLKDMESVYKPYYKGLLGKFTAKYKTSFGDSLLWGYGCITPENKFAPFVITDYPVDAPVDSLFFYADRDISSHVDEIAQDTVYYKEYKLKWGDE